MKDEIDMQKACDMADSIDPKRYAELCEMDISDEQFIVEVCRIVAGRAEEK